MSFVSHILFWTCLGYAAYHFAWAIWFRIALPRARFADHPDFKPFVSIILSLRGRDPFVAQTIRNLVDQRYPDYELQIIVDSESDPVWESLHEFEDHPRVRISVLEDRLKTCSLKCSAIVQAIAQVDKQTEVIALADADIAPSEFWLSRLTSPLRDPRIGVVTGNQWFSPTGHRVGSTVRSLWNAGALIVTFLAKHTWAGSCAMRLQDVKDSGLIEQWRKTIVDDGPIDGAMRKLSVKTVFVSDLISVNREECDFRFSVRYNSRMLTWSRIYEWGFVATFLHMLFTVSMVLSTLTVAVHEWISGHPTSALMLGGALLMIPWTLLAAYLLVESAIRAAGPEIAPRISPFSLRKAGMLLMMIPVALGVYCVSAVKATFAKQVRWREVTYEIRNRFDIQVIDDRPFSATQMPVDQTSSI